MLVEVLVHDALDVHQLGKDVHELSRGKLVRVVLMFIGNRLGSFLSLFLYLQVGRFIFSLRLLHILIEHETPLREELLVAPPPVLVNRERVCPYHGWLVYVHDTGGFL